MHTFQDLTDGYEGFEIIINCNRNGLAGQFWQMEKVPS